MRRLAGLFAFISHLSKLGSVWKQKSPVAVATRLFLCWAREIRTIRLFCQIKVFWKIYTLKSVFSYLNGESVQIDHLIPEQTDHL